MGGDETAQLWTRCCLFAPDDTPDQCPEYCRGDKSQNAVLAHLFGMCQVHSDAIELWMDHSSVQSLATVDEKMEMLTKIMPICWRHKMKGLRDHPNLTRKSDPVNAIVPETLAEGGHLTGDDDDNANGASGSRRRSRRSSSFSGSSSSTQAAQIQKPPEKRQKRGTSAAHEQQEQADLVARAPLEDETVSDDDNTRMDLDDSMSGRSSATSTPTTSRVATAPEASEGPRGATVAASLGPNATPVTAPSTPRSSVTPPITPTTVTPSSGSGISLADPYLSRRKCVECKSLWLVPSKKIYF